MQSVKFDTKKDVSKLIDQNYKDACKDADFNKLCAKTKAPVEELKKNTTKLQNTIEQIHNCEGCKGLFECKNCMNGHVLYPVYDGELIAFSYTPCKYQKKQQKQLEEKMTSSKELENARMKDIDISDANRTNTIKWLKKFYDNYNIGANLKGLYLHGSFGGGKTFLIAALFNELKLNKNARAEIVYFPEALRTLKDDWSSYNDKIDYYQTVDLLLIDDIGAEKVSDWGRDEILGTILQSRMNNKMPTFFTSNLDIKELEAHLSSSKSGDDAFKARRIIERIKQLTDDIEMISENRRK